MVGEEVAQEIDDEIAAARSAFASDITSSRSRVFEVKRLPGEVVKRIQQLDSVIIEFEERV